MKSAHKPKPQFWKAIKLAFRAWKEVRAFFKLAPEKKAIVFYAEDEASWPHYAEMIEALTTTYHQPVCYLTSSEVDPVLQSPPPNVTAFFVGDGGARTHLFKKLDSRVCALTMPDLENYHLKRSSKYDVKYAYVFHSVASSHMLYRQAAFDHYDAILCVGPHHEREIRKREVIHNLRPKLLLPHGHGRIDRIVATNRLTSLAPKRDQPTVLVSTSWGPQALIETCGAKLIDQLMACGYRVIFHPHPLTCIHSAKLVENINLKHSRNPNFVVDYDLSNQQTLQDADLMISDWSGTALEFAFGFEKPVLFFDVPRKVNNPYYGEIGTPPVEVDLRSRLGVVMRTTEIAQIGDTVKQMMETPDKFRAQITAAREALIYNLGKSGDAGAKHLLELLQDSANARRAA